jgi:hypothetical protein
MNQHHLISSYSLPIHIIQDPQFEVLDLRTDGSDFAWLDTSSGSTDAPDWADEGAASTEWGSSSSPVQNSSSSNSNQPTSSNANLDSAEPILKSLDTIYEDPLSFSISSASGLQLHASTSSVATVAPSTSASSAIDTQPPTNAPQRTFSASEVLTASILRDRQQSQSSSSDLDLENTFYILTPSTKILSLADKYRIVYIVDTSASMRVVDSTGGVGGGLPHNTMFEDGLGLGGMVGLDEGGFMGPSKNGGKAGGGSRVLISFAFETLCKCLDGVCRIFLVKNSITGKERKVC